MSKFYAFRYKNWRQKKTTFIKQKIIKNFIFISSAPYFPECFLILLIYWQITDTNDNKYVFHWSWNSSLNEVQLLISRIARSIVRIHVLILLLVILHRKLITQGLSRDIFFIYFHLFQYYLFIKLNHFLNFLFLQKIMFLFNKRF